MAQEQFKLEIGGNYFDGRGVLFTGLSCNGLFYWDIAENKTIELGEFNKEPVWRKWMSHMSVKRKNIFFILPFMAHGIPYFNMDTKEIRYCSVPDCLGDKFLYYYDYVEKNGDIYLFPVQPSEGVLVLNMEQKKVTGICSDWNKKLINNYKIKKEQFMNGFIYQKEKIWISFDRAHGIFELILNTWEIRFHEWKEIAYPVVLRTNDEGLWLEDQGEGSVYHINTSGHIIEQYKLKAKGKQVLFSKVIKLKNDIRIILPNYSDTLLIIDNNSGLHSQLLEKGDNKMIARYLCYYYLEFEEEVWLLPHSQNDIVIVNLKDYSIKYKELPLPHNLRQKGDFIFKMQRYESSYVMEDNINNIKLQDFCDYVSLKKESVSEKSIIGSYGIKVWKDLIK